MTAATTRAASQFRRTPTAGRPPEELRHPVSHMCAEPELAPAEKPKLVPP